MQAEIITIGDELLIGQVVDTNSAWIATELNRIGIEVKQITSVHDEVSHILSALEEASSRASLILLTGGLGPTRDDITKQVLCDYFHTHLVYKEEIRTHLNELYASRPEVLNRLTEGQCLFPEDCQLIPNKVGSAQVMWFEREGRVYVSMPGVPYEMKYVMEHELLPRFESRFVDGKIVHRTLLTSGVAESVLALRIEQWENALPSSMHLAYLPKEGMVRLRLTGIGVSEKEVDEQIALLLPYLSDCLVAASDTTLEVLVGECLKQRNATVCSAESCTGGKIASLLNKYAGSSAFYFGSVVAYDNSVKEKVLGVSSTDLQKYGAVSEQVVRQMAEGARQLLGTDYAVSTSGIAGPDGGTAEKPVGTVWMAVAGPKRTVSQLTHCGKLREQVTDRATQKALLLLLKEIENS